MPVTAKKTSPKLKNPAAPKPTTARGRVAEANKALAEAGVKLRLDSRRMFSADDVPKPFKVSFVNVLGISVAFTVEVPKKILVKDYLKCLPPVLTGANYAVEAVEKPVLLNFTYPELLTLQALAAPGIHWYLGQADMYKAANKQYMAIDPVGRYMRLYGEAHTKSSSAFTRRLTKLVPSEAVI
jgi:hypothetical protein